MAAGAARDACETVLVGDVETIDLALPAGTFDVILCGDLVEHRRDPDGVPVRLRPLHAPGGTLVLTTPNVVNWAMRLGLLVGRWRYTDGGILDRTHLHFFTPATLVETLQRAGYRVADLDLTVPVPVLDTPGVERAARAIGRVRPSLFAYQFVVAATPA